MTDIDSVYNKFVEVFFFLYLRQSPYWFSVLLSLGVRRLSVHKLHTFANVYSDNPVLLLNQHLNYRISLLLELQPQFNYIRIKLASVWKHRNISQLRQYQMEHLMWDKFCLIINGWLYQNHFVQPDIFLPFTIIWEDGTLLGRNVSWIGIYYRPIYPLFKHIVKHMRMRKHVYSLLFGNHQDINNQT